MKIIVATAIVVAAIVGLMFGGLAPTLTSGAKTWHAGLASANDMQRCKTTTR